MNTSIALQQSLEQLLNGDPAVSRPSHWQIAILKLTMQLASPIANVKNKPLQLPAYQAITGQDCCKGCERQTNMSLLTGNPES